MLTELSGSPLPALFQQVDKQAAAFNQAAPLITTWFLQFTNTVQHILQLKLALKGQAVAISFEGQRDAAYQNQPPAIIRVTGTCSLANPTDDRLLLGLIRSY